MRETAYAKVNLALHVRGRRPDGYHHIETLFAFCEDGDALSLEEAAGNEPELSVSGPFAEALGEAGDNLVLQVARLMMDAARQVAWRPRPRPLVRRFILDKQLPVAAGLGGGSADAAAAARLLSRAYGLFDGKELAIMLAKLGADIPACIGSGTIFGTGTGTELVPVAAERLSGLPILLVNPGVPLATGPVFAAWDGIDRGPIASGDALEAAFVGRNDLEPPAIAAAPVIREVLERLAGTAPLLARMSGSGATCFGLYPTEDDRDAAADRIAAAQPGWWLLRTRLR